MPGSKAIQAAVKYLMKKGKIKAEDLIKPPKRAREGAKGGKRERGGDLKRQEKREIQAAEKNKYLGDTQLEAKEHGLLHRKHKAKVSEAKASDSTQRLLDSGTLDSKQEQAVRASIPLRASAVAKMKARGRRNIKAQAGTKGYKAR
jgi:hypothetical protein